MSRTQTITESRPSISNREQQNSEQIPTVENQIRNYMRLHSLRQEVQRKFNSGPRPHLLADLKECDFV